MCVNTKQTLSMAKSLVNFAVCLYSRDRKHNIFYTRLLLENKDSNYVWEVSNKTDLSETGCKGAEQLHPSHDKDH
jgi:hypothetical protein